MQKLVILYKMTRLKMHHYVAAGFLQFVRSALQACLIMVLHNWSNICLNKFKVHLKTDKMSHKYLNEF